MTGNDLCVNKTHKSRSYLNHLVHPVDELNLLRLQIPVPCIPLFCFVLYCFLFCLYCLRWCCCIWFLFTCLLMFWHMYRCVCFVRLYGRVSFIRIFQLFMCFGQFLPLFFFCFFSVWVLGASFLCLFSLSVCIPFSLSFYCPCFSICIFLVPCYTLLLFFVQLSLSVYYCVIYYYRQPNNAQGATTGISAVEFGVSVMRFVAI